LEFDSLFVCETDADTLFVVDIYVVGKEGEFNVAALTRNKRFPSLDYSAATLHPT